MANRKRFRKRLAEEEPLPVTVQGEWFPESCDPEGYDPATDLWHRGGDGALETEFRLFGATTRFGFNRLLEGNRPAEVAVRLQELFGLNSRYSDDAILKAKEIITSQKALVPLEIEDTQVKLGKTQRKLKANRKKERKLREHGAGEYADRMAFAIKGQEAREQKLTEKLTEYEAHRKHGTIPKVIFGGRKLWEDLAHGRASRKDWRSARRCRLYSRGDETKGGNPNLKISCEVGKFRLDVALSHLSVKTGRSVYLRQGKRLERDTMSRAPRIRGRLWVPMKYRQLLWNHLLSGLPYAVELIRGKDERYRPHITLSLTGPRADPDLSRGVLGFDTNPNGLAVCNLDAQGNRVPFPADFTVPEPGNLGKFPGEHSFGVGRGVLWLKIPELAHAQEHRRDHLVGVLARVLVDAAKALGKPLAGESLAFRKDHDTNRVFNRMSSNFPYAKILEAVHRRCRKEGVGFRSGNPAYTSCMGLWKYARREGLSVHQASAKVIGRRVLGLPERFDPDLRRRLALLREKLVAAAEAAERQRRAPMEGTRPKLVGIAKRLRASLSEERLIRCNGYPRASGRQGRGQGRSRTSPRGALVELKRYRWARAAAVSGT